MRGWSFVTVDCVGGMATCYTGAGLAYRYFLPVAREAWNAESNVGCFCCSYNSGCNWLTGGSFAGAAPLGPSSS